MTELGICISNMYSTISDNDLDAKVREIKEYFPNHGSRMLQGCWMYKEYEFEDSGYEKVWGEQTHLIVC